MFLRSSSRPITTTPPGSLSIPPRSGSGTRNGVNCAFASSLLEVRTTLLIPDSASAIPVAVKITIFDVVFPSKLISYLLLLPKVALVTVKSVIVGGLLSVFVILMLIGNNGPPA